MSPVVRRRSLLFSNSKMTAEQVMKDINAKSAALMVALNSKVSKTEAYLPGFTELRKRFEKEQQENAEITNLLNGIKEVERQKKELDDKVALECEKENELLRRQSQLKKELKVLEKGNDFKDTTALDSVVGKLQTSLRFLQHMTGMKFLPVKDNILEGYVVSANMKDVKHFQFDLSKQTPEFVTDSLWSLAESSSDTSWDSVGEPAVRCIKTTELKTEIRSAKKK